MDYKPTYSLQSENNFTFQTFYFYFFHPTQFLSKPSYSNITGPKNKNIHFSFLPDQPTQNISAEKVNNPSNEKHAYLNTNMQNNGAQLFYKMLAQDWIIHFALEISGSFWG